MGYYSGTAGNDVLRGSDSADSIFGNGGDDTLYGYKGADTLDGGNDDDILYGGDGGDTFLYKLGQGNDTIADYTKADKIRFTDSTPTADDFSIDGNDLVINAGSGSITILNAVTNGKVNKTITYIDQNGVSHTYPEVIYYNPGRTGATLLSGYNEDSYDATALGSNYNNLVTINGSAVTHDLEITGNKKANKIFGGEGSDTIYSGTGNDTIAGGDGDDVFAFTGAGQGRNYITDYESGDVIKITSGTLDSAVLTGTNYVFTIKSGSKKTTVTVTNASNKYIQVEDANGNRYWYPDSPASDAVYNNHTMTILPGYKGDSFNVNQFVADNGFPSKVYTIDASAVTQSINIVGNKYKNTIIGSEEDDTIDGAAGADYIRGGKGDDILIGGSGKDTFAYVKGDGNDTIVDFESNKDVLAIDEALNVSSTVTSGNNVIVKISDGSAITLEGAAGKKINIKNPSINTDGDIEVGTGGKGVSLLSGYTGGSFDASDSSHTFANSVVTIDASAVTHNINITGTNNSNVIIGSKDDDTINGGGGKDTITGGEGNDVLTGGDGVDVFVYNSGDGDDVITDYTASDKIALNGVTVKSTVISADNSSDLVMNLNDSSKITVVGGIGKKISGSVNGTSTVFGGGKDDTLVGPTIEGALFNAKYTAVTLTADFMNESFTTDDYSSVQSRLKTIDASQVEHELTIGGSALANNIIGTDDDDYIYGGAGKDTLNGGKGNDSLEGGAGNDKLYGGTGKDTLWGGAGDDQLTGGGANDTFIYNGDGNDRITDYVWGRDKIVCLEGTVSNVAAEGNDVVFTMSNGNELTLVNAAGKAAQIVNGSGTILKQYTAR